MKQRYEMSWFVHAAARTGVALGAWLVAACPPSPPVVVGDAALSGDSPQAGTSCVAAAASGAGGEPMRRQVELRVLVLSARDVGTQMIERGLEEAGVPFLAVDLERPDRPAILEGFLCECPEPRMRRARFQAIVAPNEAPPQLAAEEVDALARFQREFGVRRVDGYVFPSAASGLRAAWAGPVDGMSARLTLDALAGPFRYLRGAVRFEDADPSVPESYGYLAVPAGPPAPERSFTPLLEAPAGALIGVLRDAGREEMVISVAMNAAQRHQQVLFPGILDWLTYGVHFGTQRNYLTVHIDDVLSSDARWISDYDCTRGNDCPLGVVAPDVVMSVDDVDFLANWQAQHGFDLDLVFNGGSYAAKLEDDGAFPAGDALIALDGAWFINHTYTHEYLGCVRNLTRVGFPCQIDSSGRVAWVPLALVHEEVVSNLAFAGEHQLAIDRHELVTGEHSGLRRVPDEPADNPNFLAALSETGIRWVASDASREREQRVLPGMDGMDEMGSTSGARTVPRYPMNLFFNVGRAEELVDEFNWIHVAANRGGSGLCEGNPAATCLEPLDVRDGFARSIAPREVQTTLRHALSNDPRPHYAHQSNLAEDRLLYPVLEGVLAEYAELFVPDAPLVRLRMAQAGAELRDQAQWHAGQGRVSGYVEAGRLTVEVSPSEALHVPLTLPADARGSEGDVLPRYAGQQTGWRSVKPGIGWSVSLPESVGYAR